MTPNLRNASQLGPGDDACPPAAFPQRERTGAGVCSFPETPQQVHLRLRSAPPTPQATLPCRCRAEATAQPQASLPAGLALSRTFGPLLPRCTAATFLGPSQRLKGNLSLADSRKRPRQSLHGVRPVWQRLPSSPGQAPAPAPESRTPRPPSAPKLAVAALSPSLLSGLARGIPCRRSPSAPESPRPRPLPTPPLTPRPGPRPRAPGPSARPRPREPRGLRRLRAAGSVRRRGRGWGPDGAPSAPGPGPRPGADGGGRAPARSRQSSRAAAAGGGRLPWGPRPPPCPGARPALVPPRRGGRPRTPSRGPRRSCSR